MYNDSVKGKKKKIGSDNESDDEKGEDVDTESPVLRSSTTKDNIESPVLRSSATRDNVPGAEGGDDLT